MEKQERIKELQRISNTLTTFDDFQRFAEENKIESSKELKKDYRPVYNKFYSMKFGKPITYYNDKHKWRDYNNLEDFQKFVDDNKIKNRQQLDNEYRGLSCRAERLGFIYKIKYYPDEKDLVILEEANQFIKDNNIKTLNELDLKYHDKYLLFVKVRDKINFPGINNNDWSGFNSIEVIQNFIDKNNITSRKELRKKYSGLVVKAKSIGVWDNLEFKFNLPGKELGIKERFKSQEDVQRYIDTNKIENKKQLLSTKEGKLIFGHCIRRGWEINYKNPLTHKIEQETLEDFQKFIDENEIINNSDFVSRFPGCYGKAQRLGFIKDLIFSHPRLSSLEIKVKRYLDNYKIPYEMQKEFDELSDIRCLRFDFYLKDLNLVIEPGGTQHLRPEDFFGGEDGYRILKNHDDMKREFCKKNNINIIYYFEIIRSTITKEEFLKLVSEYPGECYTKDTFDKMFERILSI